MIDMHPIYWLSLGQLAGAVAAFAGVWLAERNHNRSGRPKEDGA